MRVSLRGCEQGVFRRWDGITRAHVGVRVTTDSITRTLERALGTVGGLARLAEYLGVSESQLQDWMSGRRRAPDSVYLRALDLVASGPFASDRAPSGDK
jgi:transcriptional regulator with XRE-family HTH domain